MNPRQPHSQQFCESSIIARSGSNNSLSTDTTHRIMSDGSIIPYTGVSPMMVPCLCQVGHHQWLNDRYVDNRGSYEGQSVCNNSVAPQEYNSLNQYGPSCSSNKLQCNCHRRPMNPVRMTLKPRQHMRPMMTNDVITLSACGQNCCRLHDMCDHYCLEESVEPRAHYSSYSSVEPYYNSHEVKSAPSQSVTRVNRQECEYCKAVRDRQTCGRCNPRTCVQVREQNGGQCACLTSNFAQSLEMYDPRAAERSMRSYRCSRHTSDENMQLALQERVLKDLCLNIAFMKERIKVVDKKLDGLLVQAEEYCGHKSRMLPPSSEDGVKVLFFNKCYTHDGDDGDFNIPSNNSQLIEVVCVHEIYQYLMVRGVESGTADS